MSATYSARQTARLCDTSEEMVRRAIASGRITPTQVAGAWRLTDDDLERSCVASAAPPTQGVTRPRRAPDAAATTQDDAPASSRQSDADHWRRLVEQLRRENMELSCRVGYLMAQLDTANARIPDLSAPVESLASRDALDQAPAEMVPNRPPGAHRPP